MDGHTPLPSSNSSYPNQLDAQSFREWNTAPQAVPAQGEQDTTKYVCKTISEAEVPRKAHEKRQHTICRHPILTFCVILALIAIVIAGAVGSGLGGGGLAAKYCREELRALQQNVSSSTLTSTIPPSTSILSATVSSTPNAVAAPSTISVPETGCPSANGSIYTAIFGDKEMKFVKICDTVKSFGGMHISITHISHPSFRCFFVRLNPLSAPSINTH
jgi:hypothetical protein